MLAGNVACQPAGPSPLAEPTVRGLIVAEVPLPGGGAGPLLYTCGEFAFDPTAFAVPGTDEQAANPIAAALRGLIEQVGPDDSLVASTGWHLAGADHDSAEFVHGANGEGWTFVAAARDNQEWRTGGYGACQPKLVLPPGIDTAQWVPAPGQPITQATLTFVADVTERACNSGQAAVGRVVGPSIAFVGDRVLIAFGVREGPGGRCPGNPSVPIRVELPQAIGARALIDPALWPVAEFPVGAGAP